MGFCTKQNAPTIAAVVVVVIGVVVVILAGVMGWVVVPDIIEDKVKDEMQLSEDSDTYEKWRDIPMPIRLDVYFFNVSNYEDFAIPKDGKLDWGIHPKFEEVGPFVFDETRVKEDIREGDDDTLFYKQRITYVFNDELSGTDKYGRKLKVDTKLNILNIPFITAMTLSDIAKNGLPAWLSAIALNTLLANGETIFARDVPIGEVLFSGQRLPSIYRLIENVAKMNNIPLPDEIEDGIFAFYRGKNGTYGEGEWSVYRGIEDSSMFSIIKTVNDGKSDLKHWWDGKCAMINGTDGTMFPPFIKKSSRLYAYAAEICRSIYLEFEETTEYEDIPGYRFTIPNSMFTSPVDNPANECFCMPVEPPLNNSCDFNGMGRLFSCKANVPITISKPHFLDADEWVMDLAKENGLSPNKEKHNTYLDLEPNTGFPLRVHKRLQIGGEIQPLKTPALASMRPFVTMPHIIYPVFWADENAELTPELVDELKDKLITPLNWVKIGKWTLIGIGAFLTIGGALLFIFVFRRRKNHTPV